MNLSGLDHVVVAVGDLSAGAKAFERLGFTVTPRGEHPEWGTANHCLMFGQDYVEILGAVGQGEPAAKVRSFTAEREGLMALSIGTREVAADVDRLRRAGLEVDPPKALSRQVATPAGPKTARFAIAMLPPDATPGIPSWLCQHLTPDILRRPEWVDHPNTAIGIASVTTVVGEPGDLMPAYEAVFGPGAATPTDNTVTVHTGRGMIFLTRPDELTQLHPEAELDETPPLPALVALSLTVADTGAAAKVLDANDVDYTRDAEGTIRIPPSEACGVFLELVGA